MGKTIRFSLSEVELLSNLPTIGEKDKKKIILVNTDRGLICLPSNGKQQQKQQQLHA